jgi:hypothetical protein
MTTDLVPQPLADLAVQIRNEHLCFESALRTSLDHCKRAGELLLLAKEQVPHGEWTQYVEQQCHISRKTAWKYTTIAKRWAELAANVSPGRHLTQNQALKLLLSPPDPPDIEEEEEEDDDDVVYIAAVGDEIPAGMKPRNQCGMCKRWSAAIRYNLCVPCLVDRAKNRDPNDPAHTYHVGKKIIRTLFPMAPVYDTKWRDEQCGSRAWEMLLHSIRRDGIRKPILVDEKGDLIDGRQRLLAAAELGLNAKKIPIRVVRHLTLAAKAKLWILYNLDLPRTERVLSESQIKEARRKFAQIHADLRARGEDVKEEDDFAWDLAEEEARRRESGQYDRAWDLVEEEARRRESGQVA